MNICLCAFIMWTNIWSYNYEKWDTVLAVLRHFESSDGYNCTPRYEEKFLMRHRNSIVMKRLIAEYGERDAASSFGPYQVMLVVAWERGFKNSPDWLQVYNNNEMVAIAQLNWIESQVGDNLFKIFLRWNGSVNYANKAVAYWHKLEKGNVRWQ